MIKCYIYIYIYIYIYYYFFFLGPSERDDVCTTCGQNSVFCPGHMGHIELPLPVFNPIYFKTLFRVNRFLCLTLFFKII